MRPRPLRVALTGGIATGKSYCLKQFVALGVPVVDADRLAHEVIAHGTPGGAAVLDLFGTLDRGLIAAVIFREPQARLHLEAIVHPAVYSAINEWFAGLKAASPFGIADIPLVFETAHEREFDRVIITNCRPDQQRARLAARGLSNDDAEARIGTQLPFEIKVKRAKSAGIGFDVIDTSMTKAETDAQVDKIFETLANTPPRVCD